MTVVMDFPIASTRKCLHTWCDHMCRRLSTRWHYCWQQNLLPLCV